MAVTIISMNEFERDRQSPGKPASVVGEPIPDKYKMPNTTEHSPIENQHNFALPNETNQKHSEFNEKQFGASPFRDFRSLDDDPSISDMLKRRLRGIPDYSNTYDNATVKQYGGYILRMDPTHPYWHIEGIPGLFTRLKFAYDKIDEINRLKENPELQDKMIEDAKQAANARHQETSNN